MKTLLLTYTNKNGVKENTGIQYDYECSLHELSKRLLNYIGDDISVMFYTLWEGSIADVNNKKAKLIIPCFQIYGNNIVKLSINVIYDGVKIYPVYN